MSNNIKLQKLAYHMHGIFSTLIGENEWKCWKRGWGVTHHFIHLIMGRWGGKEDGRRCSLCDGHLVQDHTVPTKLNSPYFQ